MNIVIFGPPGAGKGTQSDNLVKDLNLFKVSTGDLLREEIKKKSFLGAKIKSIIDQGNFAPDELVHDLVKKILSNIDYSNRLVFDGYPRNLNQSKNLDILLKKYNQKIFCVFNLKVNKQIVVKRILGRQVCSKCGLIFNKYFNPENKTNHSCGSVFLQKRSDDYEKTVEKRLTTYDIETSPVLDYYKNQNLLHEIEGEMKIDEIYKEIRNIIGSLDA